MFFISFSYFAVNFVLRGLHILSFSTSKKICTTSVFLHCIFYGERLDVSIEKIYTLVVPIISLVRRWKIS